MDNDDAVLAAFHDACKDVASTQDQALKCILQASSSSIYLQRYNVVDVETFKANVPVVTYEDIASDVQRIVDGDMSPVLCEDPIRFFASSSGTTTGGKSKMFPLTTKAFTSYFEAAIISAANKRRLFKVETGLGFNHACEQLETRTGIKVAGGTTLAIRSKEFQDQNKMYTSPLAVAFASLQESIYCHWLCALMQRTKVHFLHHSFAYGMVDALKSLEKNWEDLCHDIRTGTLNRKVEDQETRAAVSQVLHADTELADLMNTTGNSNSWSGVLPKLFPAAKYVMTVVTGSMKPYIPALKHYAGGLQIVGGDYIASEGYLGINIEVTRQPEDVTFVFVPMSIFLEFLPYCGAENSTSAPLGLADLQVGQLYEVVVTNFGGLYRYRVGDIVKVAGYFHGSPCVSFSHRLKAILTVNWDKTTENELQDVVMKASRECNIEIVDFTSKVDFSVEPGRYIIFWELEEPMDYTRHEQLQKCAGILDTSFNLTYLEERDHDTIGPLLLVTVEQGTFKRIMHLALENKAAASMQYKTPRCIVNQKLLEILIDGQVGQYESFETPSCDISSEVPDLVIAS